MDYPLAFTLRDKFVLTKLIQHLKTDGYQSDDDRRAIRNMMSTTTTKRNSGGVVDHAIPCRYAILMGDGGSGKSTAVTNLKSLLPGLAYTGPTNESGFAFLSVMNCSVQSCTELKDHYPTIHKFLNINVEESTEWLNHVFSKYVTDEKHFPDYSSYMQAHKIPFQNMVNLVADKFKRIHPNAITPDQYRSIKKRLSSKGLPTDHKSILNVINDAGKLHLVPPLLRYSYFVFDECGRFPVVYVLFFIYGHSWFRYHYGADDREKIKIVCLGSVTQSNVIVDNNKIATSSHARISPLSVVNKPFWLPEKEVYAKTFKLNRRRLEGNLNRTLLLSMFVEQLESGECIEPELAEKFRKEFCVPHREFENIERFKGHTFLAPRHSDLAAVREAIEETNKSRIRTCKEYIFADIPIRDTKTFYSTKDLSREIQSKFKSVYKDNSFRYEPSLQHYNRFTERNEAVYSIGRKLVIDQLVTLTHIHEAYLDKVSGSVKDVAKMISFLTPIIKTSESCLRFFSRVLVNAMDNPSEVCDTLDAFVISAEKRDDDDDDEGRRTRKRNKRKRTVTVDPSLIQQFDILLQRLQSEIDEGEKKETNDVCVIAPPGVRIVFDANKYEFVVIDYILANSSKRMKTNVDIRSSIYLKYMNCLLLTMNRKRIRVKLPTERKNINNNNNERIDYDDVDDSDEYVTTLAKEGVEEEEEVPPPPKNGYNAIAFVYPVAPIYIATIAYTQGRSLSHPLIVRINKKQDAYSVITALTRSEYPDTLTVAADELTSIKPLDSTTVELVKYIENKQSDLI